MITRAQIWRAVQTIAVPVLLGLISRQIWPNRPEKTPKSLYLPLLADIDFVPRKLPATYRKHSSDFDAYEHVSVLPQISSVGPPNVTAVILNWSRFPNVVLIASLLCGPWLEGTISEVFIWNNSPRKISYEVCISFQFPPFFRQLTRDSQEMKNTGCRKSKLRIHNAPANMLFQARFMACAQANTPYCFIQVSPSARKCLGSNTRFARLTYSSSHRRMTTTSFVQKLYNPFKPTWLHPTLLG